MDNKSYRLLQPRVQQIFNQTCRAHTFIRKLLLIKKLIVNQKVTILKILIPKGLQITRQIHPTSSKTYWDSHQLINQTTYLRVRMRLMNLQLKISFKIKNLFLRNKAKRHLKIVMNWVRSLKIFFQMTCMRDSKQSRSMKMCKNCQKQSEKQRGIQKI